MMDIFDRRRKHRRNRRRSLPSRMSEESSSGGSGSRPAVTLIRRTSEAPPSVPAMPAVASLIEEDSGYVSSSSVQSHALSASRVWKYAESMSSARSGLAAVSIRNRIFILGGQSPECRARSNWQGPPIEVMTVGPWRTERNEWHISSEMMQQRNPCAAAVLGLHKIMVVGASTNSKGSTAVLYDVETHQWTELPDMNSRRRGCALASLGDQAYVFGGEDYEPSAEVYTSTTQTWRGLPAMPTKRAHCAAVAVDNRTIIVLGGTSKRTGQPLATVEAYDAGTDSWKSLPSMKTPRSSCAAVALHGFVVVMGGTHTGPSAEVYDSRTGNWTELPSSMRTTRTHFAAAVCGEATRLFVYGGLTADGTPTSTVEEFPLHGLSSLRERVTFPPLPALSPPNATTIRYAFGQAEVLERYADDLEKAIAKVEQSLSEALLQLRKSRDEDVRQLEDQILATSRKCQQRVDSVKLETNSWLDETRQKLDKARLEAAEMRRNEQQNLLSTKSNRRDSHSSATAASMILDHHHHHPDMMDDVPGDVCCKITGDLMDDPVVAMDGHTYEREAIETWFAQFPPECLPRSPVTNQTLCSRALIENHTSRKQCREFFERRRNSVSLPL